MFCLSSVLQSKLRREQRRTKSSGSDTASIDTSAGDEPRKKLKTLLREKGYHYVIDDQRRFEGEMRIFEEDLAFDDIVQINVGGIIYETRRSTLKRFPQTLMGSPGFETYYSKSRKMYFLDRHRSAFSAILAFYQSGGLLCIPSTIHPLVFLEEARFYLLGTRIIDKLESPFFVRKRRTPGTMKKKIWFMLDDPASSRFAKTIAFFDLGCIITAIAIICIKSLPQFHYLEENITSIEDNKEAAFFILETACMIWFTMDLFLRLFMCPSKKEFCKNPLNLIDIVSIVPYYLELMVPSKVQVLLVIRIIRFTKIFRIFKLSRHFRGLIALGLALRHSVSEILVLFVFLMVAVLFFATIVFFAEENHPDTHFDSGVIGAFWWAIVTITSVGYGDEVPKTGIGMLTGAFCAITGIIFVALPVPIIVSRFNYFLQLENEKCRIGADDDISIYNHPTYSAKLYNTSKRDVKPENSKTSSNNNNSNNSNNNDGDINRFPVICDVENGTPKISSPKHAETNKENHHHGNDHTSYHSNDHTSYHSNDHISYHSNNSSECLKERYSPLSSPLSSPNNYVRFDNKVYGDNGDYHRV